MDGLWVAEILVTDCEKACSCRMGSYRAKKWSYWLEEMQKKDEKGKWRSISESGAND